MTRKDDALDRIGTVIWMCTGNGKYSVSKEAVDKWEQSIGYRVGIDKTCMGKWSEVLVSASGLKVCSLIVLDDEVLEKYYPLRTLSQKEVARAIQFSRPSEQLPESMSYE